MSEKRSGLVPGTIWLLCMVPALGVAANPLDSLPASGKEGLGRGGVAAGKTAPVRVRVKRPASAAQIDPGAWDGGVSRASGGSEGAAYGGKCVEVPERAVNVPTRVWRQGDLDELPAPAWEGCEKTEPRYRPLEKPHGRLSAGFIYRDFGRTQFETRSYSRESHVPPPPPGIQGAPPVSGLADREYDNGYVRVGQGTPATGLTTYWGWEDGAQYDDVQGTLAFDGSGIVFERSEFGAADNTESWGEDDEGLGPMLTYDLLFPISENWRIGQQTSVSYVRTGSSRTIGNFRAQYRDDLYEVYFTDTFDLGGIVPPGPPYGGTFAGPGPVIPNEPMGRDINDIQYLATTEGRVWNEIYQELSLDLYTVSLGPVVEFDLGPLYAQASGGLSINVADYDATHFERLYVSVDGGEAVELRQWFQDNSGTRVLWGGYVQGTLGIQLSRLWSLSGFARYDWNQDLEGSIGPSDFRMELSAFSTGAQVGFSF